jgi:hypothetical protein
MVKVKITNTDIPVCGDGCCSKEIMILEVAGREFEYDGDFMYEKDSIEQYETIIKDLLGAMNVECDIVTRVV